MKDVCQISGLFARMFPIQYLKGRVVMHHLDTKELTKRLHNAYKLESDCYTLQIVSDRVSQAISELKEVAVCAENIQELKSQAEKLNGALAYSRQELDKLYAMDWLPVNYQNLHATGSLYLYLIMERCDALEGEKGAYAIFEKESQGENFTWDLQKAAANLSKTEVYQFMLFITLLRLKLIMEDVEADIQNAAKSETPVGELIGIASAYRVLCSINPDAPNPDAPVKLWWAYNTENLLQDQNYAELIAQRDSTLRLHTLRGDVESAQLMVTTGNAVEAYDFTVSDLKNENGASIGACNVEVCAASYFEIYNTYNIDAPVGYYPDPLIPIENLKNHGENKIAAGKNQAIWLNVTIPADAQCGKYTGVGTLTADGASYCVPIELTVYDATMPEQVHAETQFAIWWKIMHLGEPEVTHELNEAYFWFLVNKRIMPMDPDKEITGVDPDAYTITDYERYIDYVVENLAENPKIANYALPYVYLQKEGFGRIVDKEDMLKLLNKMVDRNIALRKAGNHTIDLFKKARYYLGCICDEPQPSAYPIVRASDLIITECKQEVAKRLEDYPDIQESLLSLKHIVTVKYCDELVGSDTVGGVQTWCPMFDDFHSEENRKNYQARQKSTLREKGENVWWYGCILPKAPFPTYHTDDNLIGSRVLTWMQYDYGIEGNLYWAANYWQKYNGKKQNVWTETLDWDVVAGEGRIIYPGYDYGIFGPISSMRAESIREGCEDYELFYLFTELIDKYNAQHNTQIDSVALLRKHFFCGLYHGAVPVRGHDDNFHAKRIALLQTLQAMNRDLDCAVAELLK